MTRSERLAKADHMTPDNYKPVPVEAAREIAEKYDKSIVIVFSHDPVHGLMHTTTYGSDPQNKAWAAQGGEIATRALGGLTELATDFEDYRLAQAKKLLAALKGVMAQVEKGALVRETVNDGAPGFGMRQLPLVMALTAAYQAIEEAEKFLGREEFR